ncbi:fumarylacetoacetate hydrolase family protein [Streptomyces sp. NBC_00457]
MLFDVATVIVHVSSAVILLPGDLITTGTPAVRVPAMNARCPLGQERR